VLCSSKKLVNTTGIPLQTALKTKQIGRTYLYFGGLCDLTEKRAYFDEFFLTGSVFKKLGSPPDMVTLKSIRPCKAVFKAHMVLNFSLVLFLF
jgi:hypothetical protein